MKYNLQLIHCRIELQMLPWLGVHRKEIIAVNDVSSWVGHSKLKKTCVTEEASK